MNRRQAMLTMGGVFVIPFGGVTKDTREKYWPDGTKKPEGEWDIEKGPFEKYGYYANSVVLRDMTITAGRKGLTLINCYLNGIEIIVTKGSGPFRMIGCVVDLRKGQKGNIVRFKRDVIDGDEMTGNVIHGNKARGLTDLRFICLKNSP